MVIPILRLRVRWVRAALPAPDFFLRPGCNKLRDADRKNRFADGTVVNRAATDESQAFEYAAHWFFWN